uniref:Uncharacterized protein n=1 Tax=Lactuca sativa TaxID=4236 RepID=A0A9R1VYX1_LACSA|nr:hypothetical protein LSAT_V11C300127080 [Lactuca sativa]
MLKLERPVTTSPNDDFAIMNDFDPSTFNEDYWDTDAWRKKSAAGRTNHMSDDNTDIVSRYIRGIEGLRSQKELKRISTFLELFLITHLTPKGEKKFKSWSFVHLLLEKYILVLQLQIEQ